MNILPRLQLARDPSITVANLVDELIRRKGDCITSISEEGPFHLSELHDTVQSLDAFLRQTVHLQPGQPVAIYRTNTRRCLHWFLAIIRAGGIAVPLNPQLSRTELQRILRESGTEILITDQTTFNRTIQTRANLPIQTWIDDSDPLSTDNPIPNTEGFLRPTATSQTFPPTTINPAATIAVFHTSGTSGFPKGAALSSRALLGARSTTVLASLFLGPKDLALVALPWSHIMAVSIALNGLIAGIPGCFLNRFDVAGALDLVERLQITTFVGVPEMFARLVNSSPSPARLATIRVWLSASDHLPSEVRQRLRKFGAFFRLPKWLPGSRRIPSVILNGYGMVELGSLAMMGIDLSFAPGSGDLCFPVPPFQIRIADEHNRPVPANVTGECQIRRRGLKPHYWNETQKEKQPSSTEPLLTPDGWLRTGDLATRNRLGLIRLTGRIKDVIKSGGYSVYVRELEEALLAHPAVARAAAFGLPHAEKGEIPAAAVELHASNEATEEDLITWSRQHLAAYKSPRHIWIVEALPQNHNGKLLRQALREQYSQAETNPPTHPA